MSIYTALLLSAGLFVALNFWLLPVVENAWASSKAFQKFAKIPTLAGLKTARGFAQIALIVFALESIALVAATLFFGGPTVRDAAALRTTILDLQSSVSALQKSGWVGTLPTIIALAILAILAQRRNALSYREQLDAVVRAQWLKYLEDRASGKLNELPDTEALYDLRNLIAQKRSNLTQLAAHPDEQEYQPNAGELLALEEKYAQIDFLRRVDLSCDPPDLDPNRRRGWWPDLLTIFVSKGFARDRKLLGKAAGAFASIALLGSFTGASAALLEATLDEEIERIAAIEIKLSKDEAEASLQQVLAPKTARAVSAPKYTEQQQNANLQTARQLTRLYWQAKAASPASLVESGNKSVHAIDNAQVRREILINLPGNARTDDNPLTPKATINTREVDNEVAAILRTSDGHQPGPGGGSFTQEVERVQKSSPSWTAVQDKVAAYVAEYRVPVSSSSVAEELLESLYKGTLDKAVPAQDMNWAEKKVRSLLSNAAKKQIGGYMDASFKRFLRDLVGATSLQAALERVKGEAKPNVSPIVQGELDILSGQFAESLKTAEGHLADLPMTLRGRSTPLQHEARILELIEQTYTNKSIRRSTDYSDLRNATSVAADFEDYFPGQVGAEMSTKQARLAAALQASLKIPETSSERIEQIANANFERARSYEALRGFSRVGGVLLGDGPTSIIATPDIRGIRWTRSGSTFTFTLEGHAGATVRGPFRSSIVRQALAYAADGRLVAVTVISAEPLLGRKVIMHPAVEDTALGCRLVALDHLAFMAQAKSPELKAQADSVRARNAKTQAIYTVAHAERLERYRQRLLASRLFRKELRELIEAHRAMQTPSMEHVKAIEAAEPAIDAQTAKSMFDGTATPFTVKNKYYGESLLAVMRTCIGTEGGSWKRLQECIQIDVDGLPLNAETYEALNEAPPTVTEVSGVRDVDYRVDPALAWFRSKGERADLSIRFMDTLTFTSPPQFNLSARDTPWEFGALSDATNTAVRKIGLEQSNIGQIITDADEFNVLQRFFRLAMDGRLGTRFPTSALSALARELKSIDIADFPVQRWIIDVPSKDQSKLVKSSLSQFMNMLRKDASRNPASAGFLASAQACSTSFDRTGDLQRSAAVCRFENDDSKLKKLCIDEKTSNNSACKHLQVSRKLSDLLARLELIGHVAQEPKTALEKDTLGIARCPDID